MIVKLDQIGKRYRDWIIQDCTLDLEGPSKIGIAGTNGSGKSTLLKILSGYLTPSSGDISWGIDHTETLEPESLAKHVNFYGPYSRGIEELTLEEHLDFHCTFKSLHPHLPSREFFALTRLEDHRKKFLKSLSSGLYQRFMLGLTMASEGHFYLFDEPCSFLDASARAWFFKTVADLLNEKLVLIASNQAEVLQFCDRCVAVEDYKRIL